MSGSMLCVGDISLKQMDTGFAFMKLIAHVGQVVDTTQVSAQMNI